MLDKLESRKIVRLIFYTVLFISLSLIVATFNSAFVVVILFIIACVSTLYRLFLNVPIGFELITLMVILFSFRFSLLFTITMMILAVFTARIISGGISPKMFTQIMNYMIIILISPFFLGLGIVTGGMTLVVILNMIRFWVNMFIFGSDPVTSLIPNVGSIVIYYVIMTNFASSILALLG